MTRSPLRLAGLTLAVASLAGNAPGGDELQKLPYRGPFIQLNVVDVTEAK